MNELLVDIERDGLRWQIANGALLCLECEKNWCRHIRQAILDKRDARLINARLLAPEVFNVEDGLLIVFDIPVSPDYAGLWVTTHLEPVKIRGVMPAFEVTLPPPAGQGEVLCYLMPGDGLAVVRSILLDRVREATKTVPVKCNSGKHNFKEEMHFQKARNAKATRLVEYTAIVMKGACTACLAKGVVNFDDDDLIPDAGSTRGFPTRVPGPVTLPPKRRR